MKIEILDTYIPGTLEYMNIPRTIGAVISAHLATLHECETIYSTEDVYLMVETLQIDAHNRYVADKYFKAQQKH